MVDCLWGRESPLYYSNLSDYWDESCYFHCPTAYIPNMDGEWVGKLSRVDWIIATGEYDTIVDKNREFSSLLWSKGIPNHLEIWGGVTTSDSRQVKVTDAPAGEIWLILRLEEVPFHHRLLGTEASSKRAPESA